MPRLFRTLTLAGLIGLAGCHCCRRETCVAERAYACNRFDPGPQPPHIRSRPGAVVVPPPGAVPPPPPAGFVPPSAEKSPPATIERPETPPPPPPGESSPSQLGMADTQTPGLRLGPPGPIRRESASVAPDSASTKEPPLAAVPNPPGGSEGSPTEDKDTPQPIDLPGFAQAIPGVATGIRPFPDGITWLAEKNYKAVLHLHAPGEDTTAARKMFEKKGLKYLSLQASPARLNKAVYEQFVKLVNDNTSHPLFVFDKDGSVAGGLWYLYFRVHLKQSDEKARAEAQRLGLRLEDDSEHKAMLLAVQKLLETLKP